MLGFWSHLKGMERIYLPNNWYHLSCLIVKLRVEIYLLDDQVRLPTSQHLVAMAFHYTAFLGIMSFKSTSGHTFCSFSLYPDGHYCR